MSAELESMAEASCRRKVLHYRHGQLASDEAMSLPTETPVALVYNGIAHSVMMCSASDLEDFAIGFTLSEGIIDHHREIHDLQLVAACQGWEIRIELANRCVHRLQERRRSLTGRTGCGICGSESLQQVLRALPRLPDSARLDLSGLTPLLEGLKAHQPLGALTGATHAALHLSPTGGITAIREDVGRHIALDKLIGHLARHPGEKGAILVTSRASYEMVQKTASAGIEILLAISAATALAVECAEQCGLTLVGFCRPGRAEIYCHGQRIVTSAREAEHAPR